MRAISIGDTARGTADADIDRYLDVVKKSLTRAVSSEKYRPLGPVNPWRQAACRAHPDNSRHTVPIT